MSDLNSPRNLDELFKRQPKSSPAYKPYSPSSAVKYINTELTKREYAQYTNLELLGLEDKLAAKIDWLTALSRPVPIEDTRSLESIRAELKQSSRHFNLIHEDRPKWAEHNKWLTLYPDEGPHRRELYYKHMDVYRMTATHNEVLALGSNRCISPWTPIETDHATRLTSELIGGSGFDVLSWDGGSRCTRRASSVFLKGIEPMFRLHLDNGSTLDVTRKHRVLLASESGVRRPSDWVSIDRLILASSGLRCIRTHQDYQASCGKDGRPCGGQSPLGRGSDLSRLQSGAGAHLSSQTVFSRVGEVEPIQEYTHAYPESFHYSIQDDPDLLSDLCGLYLDPSSLISGLYEYNDLQELLLFASEYGRTQLRFESHGRSQSIHLPLFGGIEVHFSCSDFAEWRDQDRGQRLSAPNPSHRLSVEEFLNAAAYSEIFLSLDSPRLECGARIEYIIPIGLNPVLDFEVEGSHNYITGGVVNHNSGKSYMGAYMTVCHTTGIYPPWWEGRRFTEPILAWIANKGAKDVRDINEKVLLGPPEDLSKRGTGMLPGHRIIKCTPKTGIPNGTEFIDVAHVSGGVSRIQSKSFDQGREAFQGTSIPFIWLDEECPDDVYGECLLRTMDCSGLVVLTFTPVLGLTTLTSDFLSAAGIEITDEVQTNHNG